MKLNDDEGAIADFTEVIKINPVRFYSYLLRAEAKYSLKYFKDVISDYNMVIKLNPNYAEAYYYRGYANIYINKKFNGCIDFIRAEELGYEDAYKGINKYCNE